MKIKVSIDKCTYVYVYMSILGVWDECHPNSNELTSAQMLVSKYSSLLKGTRTL